MTRIKLKIALLFLLTAIIGCTNSDTTTIQKADTGINSKCLLDSLTTDTLKIYVATYGCEPFFSEQLSFYKYNDSLFAELLVIGNDRETIGKLTSFVTDTMELAYTKFEEDVKAFKNEGPPSTTQTIYKISHNSNRLEFTDNRKEFDGFEKLRDKIFGPLTAKDRKIMFKNK